MTEFVHTLVMLTVQSGIIWTALMLFRRWGRLTPGVACLLWILLFARLCIPVTWDLPSLAVQPPGETQSSPVSPAQSGIPASSRSAPEISPIGGSGSAKSAPEPSQLWEPAAFWIYIAGLCGAALRFAASWRSLRRSMRLHGRSASEDICSLVRELCRENGVRTEPEVLLMPGIGAPALAIAGKPAILLPTDFSSRPRSDLRQALLHEVMHIRRRDHIAEAAMQCIAAVWWFNPFVHLGHRAAGRDIERACDQAATKRMSAAERANYARLIVSVAETKASLALGLRSRSRDVESRVRSVFGPKRTSLWAKVATAGLCGLLAFSCFTTAGRTAAPWEPILSSTGLPRQALRQSMEPGHAALDTDAAYTATGHWSEEIQLDDRFSIHAGADILEPVHAALPVKRLASTPFTSAEIERLAVQFAGDGRVQLLPVPWTRADIHAEIGLFREVLADAEQMGDAAAAQTAQERMDELEVALADAPDAVEATPTDLKTAITAKLGAESSFLAAKADIKGQTILLSANVPGLGGTGNTHFSFSRGSFVTKSADAELADQNPVSLSAARAAERLSRYTSIGLEAARRQGEAILAELQIGDLSLTACEPALWEPFPSSAARALEGSKDTFTRTGTLLKYERRPNGMPLCAKQALDGLPGPGFGAESVYLLLDSAGDVQYFCWLSPSEDVETIAEDSNILPVDSLREQVLSAAEERMRAVAPQADGRTHTLEPSICGDIRAVQLVMGYGPVPGQNRQAFVLPVWKVRLQILRYAESPQLKHPVEEAAGSPILVDEELLFSALNGTLISVSPV